MDIEMSPVHSIKYHKVTNFDVQIGQPIKHSIYSGDGKLLLKQGQNIVSERQQSVLLENGFVDPYEPASNSQGKNQSKRMLRKYLEELLAENSLSKRRLREIQLSIWNSNQDDDILITGPDSAPHEDNLVELKEALLNSLLYAFNFLNKNAPVKFKFSIMSLALAIQFRCTTSPEGLFGAIQVDRELGYCLTTSLRRAVICELLAKHAGLNEIDRLPLICGALTCDMGFVDTQNELARQTEPLTDEQQVIIENHPIKSEKILRDAGIDDSVWLDVVRHHHERHDGSGYPDALSKDEISLPARITAIADTFSAMLTTTSYRSTITSNGVIKFLYSERNKLFDSKTVNLFIKVVGLYPPGSLVKLKNNEIGVVIGKTKGVQTPKVLTLIKSDGTLTINLLESNADDPDCKIITALPLNKYNILEQQLEKIWGGFK